MKEIDLVREKAATLDEAQVRSELDRIERGIATAQSGGAYKRYVTRKAVYRARLTKLRSRDAMRRSAAARRST